MRLKRFPSLKRILNPIDYYLKCNGRKSRFDAFQCIKWICAHIHFNDFLEKWLSVYWWRFGLGNFFSFYIQYTFYSHTHLLTIHTKTYKNTLFSGKKSIIKFILILDSLIEYSRLVFFHSTHSEMVCMQFKYKCVFVCCFNEIHCDTKSSAVICVWI